MEKYSYILSNIKCNGCKTTIVEKIESFDGVSNIKVEIDSSKIEFDAPSSSIAENVLQGLEKLGYTKGSPTNIQTAKSYVSCMIGKFKN